MIRIVTTTQYARNLQRVCTAYAAVASAWSHRHYTRHSCASSHALSFANCFWLPSHPCAGLLSIAATAACLVPFIISLVLMRTGVPVRTAAGAACAGGRCSHMFSQWLNCFHHCSHVIYPPFPPPVLQVDVAVARAAVRQRLRHTTSVVEHLSHCSKFVLCHCTKFVLCELALAIRARRGEPSVVAVDHVARNAPCAIGMCTEE